MELQTLLRLFVVIWLFCGSAWVYGCDYTCQQGCDKLLYDFAFWIISSVFIAVLVLLVVLPCLVLYSRLLVARAQRSAGPEEPAAAQDQAQQLANEDNNGEVNVIDDLSSDSEEEDSAAADNLRIHSPEDSQEAQVRPPPASEFTSVPSSSIIIDVSQAEARAPAEGSASRTTSRSLVVDGHSSAGGGESSI